MVYSLSLLSTNQRYKKYKRKGQQKEQVQVSSVVPDDDDEEMADELISDFFSVVPELTERSPKSQDIELQKHETERTMESTTYRTIKEDDITFEISKRKDRVVVHFFHSDHSTECELIDKHLTNFSSLYSDMKKIFSNEATCFFFRINSQEAPLLVIKYKIHTYPTVLVVENGEILSRFCFDLDIPKGDAVLKLQDWLIEMGFSTQLSFDNNVESSPDRTINKSECTQKCVEDSSERTKRLSRTGKTNNSLQSFVNSTLSMSIHGKFSSDTSVKSMPIVFSSVKNLLSQRSDLPRVPGRFSLSGQRPSNDKLIDMHERNEVNINSNTAKDFAQNKNKNLKLNNISTDSSMETANTFLKTPKKHRRRRSDGDHAFEEFEFLEEFDEAFPPERTNNHKTPIIEQMPEELSKNVKDEHRRRHSDNELNFEASDFWGDFDEDLNLGGHNIQPEKKTNTCEDKNWRRHSGGDLVFEPFISWDEELSVGGQSRKTKGDKNKATRTEVDSIQVEDKYPRRHSDINFVSDVNERFEETYKKNSSGEKNSSKTKKKTIKVVVSRPRGVTSEKKKNDIKEHERKTYKSKRTSISSQRDVVDNKTKDMRNAKTKQNQQQIRRRQSDSNLHMVDLFIVEKALQNTSFSRIHAKEFAKDNFYGMKVKDVVNQRKDRKVSRRKSETDMLFKIATKFETPRREVRKNYDICSGLKNRQFKIPLEIDCISEDDEDDYYYSDSDTTISSTRKEDAIVKDNSVTKRSSISVDSGSTNSLTRNSAASRQQISRKRESAISRQHRIEFLLSEATTKQCLKNMESRSTQRETNGRFDDNYIMKGSDGKVRKRPSYKTMTKQKHKEKPSIKCKETKSARLKSVKTDRDAKYFDSIDMPSAYPNVACRRTSHTKKI